MQKTNHIDPDFIIVDDDEISNFICQTFIKEIIPGASIRCFIDPVEGLEFTESSCKDNSVAETILILDINMPKLTGWQFLDALKELYKKDCIHFKKIFMLSSSVDPMEKQKSDLHYLVSGYIEKPLSFSKLQIILNHTEAVL